ncbi:MAG: hypothetical protein IKT76_05165, partial [Bacteroides sp.]|nr:hypothetical protein [Bacteroides sp.]
MKRLLYIALLLSTSLYAQEQKNDSLLNRTVVVEQEYSPLIEDATKINVLPQVEAPSVENRPVEYSMEVMATKQFPYEQMNNYTATEQQPTAKPGYLRLGAGNYGKVDFYGNYLFNLSDNDKLNIQADLNGHNGAYKQYDSSHKWDSYFYRTRAGVEYAHAFNKVTLQAGGHFGLSNFNHLTYTLYETQIKERQRFTSGDVQVGIKSNNTSEKYQYDIHTALLLYQRAHEPIKPIKETIIRTNANFYTSLPENNSIVGLNIQINNNFIRRYTFKKTKKYTYSTIDFNPYYQVQSDDWQLKLGAIAALGTKFDEEFYLAPDFCFDYTKSKSSSLYIKLTGGRRINDLRHLETIAPYTQIEAPFKSGFEQLNAAAGYKIGSNIGFYMHLFGGYQMLKNEVVPTFVKPYEDDPFRYYYKRWEFVQCNLSNFYIGTDLAYHYKQLLGIEASIMYRNWETNNSIKKLNGHYFLLPKISANVAFLLNPIHDLQCEVGYQYIGYVLDDTPTIPNQYANLYVKADYTLFNGIGIYA